MGIGVKSTDTQYTEVKINGSEQKEPAYMNSAFTEAAKSEEVADRNSCQITEEHSSGVVKINVNELFIELPSTVMFEDDTQLSKEDQKEQVKSNLMIAGVSITDIREKIGQGSDIPLSPRECEAKSDEELYDFINEYIQNDLKTELFSNPSISGLSETQKEKLYNEVLLPCWLKSLSSEEVLQVLDMAVGCFKIDELVEDTSRARAIFMAYSQSCLTLAGRNNALNNQKGLYEIIGEDFKNLEDNESKVEALKKYLDDFVKKEGWRDPEHPGNKSIWLAELLRLSLFSNSEEEKYIIAQLIKEVDENPKTTWGDLSQSDVFDILKDSCRTKDEQKGVYRGASENANELSKDVVNRIVEEFAPGGALSGLDECDKNKFKEIQTKLENGEEIDEADRQFYEDCIRQNDRVREVAENITKSIASRTGKDYTADEATTAIGTVSKGVASCGEETYREYQQNVYNWLQENHGQLNITPEQFAEIMNNATNGNYQIIVDDLLRGDGVQTPLNMPETNSGSGVETGSGNGNSSGAQDPSTGFFSVPSQQIIANVQNNINQLNQSIAQASATDNSPKPVQQETTVNTSKGIDSILTSDGNDLVDAVKTYIQKEGVVSFVKDAFNSSVAMKNTYIRQKALNFFENVIPKATRLLTFDKGIHNSANAELAARTMTADELSQVHAQNQYLAERIEAIKEEKEKQQGLA